MEPVDGFGRPIYPRTFEEMKRNAEVLVRLGYKEARRKPNLFFFKNKTVGAVFYADMRGTEEIPIWRDTKPQFSVKWEFEKDYSDYDNIQIIQEHLFALKQAGCNCRVKYWGLCYCGKEFVGEGSFCTKACEKAYQESLKTSCAVCGKRVDQDCLVAHHVSYDPEETKLICHSCHMKIHRSDHYPNLKPKGSRQDFEQAMREKACLEKQKRDKIRAAKKALEEAERQKKRLQKKQKAEERWKRIRKYKYLD